MKCALLISHGSRSKLTKEEVTSLADKIRKKSNIDNVQIAFLEIESPNIPEGIDSCIDGGADEVVVVLNFLNSGRHVSEDIPAIIDQAKSKYPQVNFITTQPIGQHEKLVDLFVDLINSSNQ